MQILYNSQDEKYKSPYGAIICNTEINFNIKIEEKENIDEVTLVILEDNKYDVNSPKRIEYSMIKKDYKENINGQNFVVYNVKIMAPVKPKLLFYYFELKYGGWVVKYYGNNFDSLSGEGNLYDSYPNLYQITTYEEYNKTPDWFKNSIIYQIFPDRFFNGNKDQKINSPKKNSFIYGNWDDLPMYIKDNNGEILRWDFYGGNILGVTKKLDYLKDLGVNLIYLNPIFKARSNHRYDTGDYTEIDSMLGSEKDFQQLIKEAKKRGINIILDGVFNHTGQDSKYFNRFNSYNSIGAYNSRDSKYYDWYIFKDYPNDYESWWGVKDLPTINKKSKAFVDYIINNDDSVVNKWLNMGIKGWRLDVADELSENFLKQLRKKCHEINEESVILGEVWEDATNKISYGVRREYMCGDELDSVTNYSFKNYFLDFFRNNIDSYKLKKLFERMKENYPRENFYALVNILGTHDVERILTELSKISKEKSIDLFKLIITMQMTFFGVPLIYYGDETGVLGGKDPDNRRTFPWGNENKDITDFYKKMTKLRNENPFLATGEFKQIAINSDVYGIIRYPHNGLSNDKKENKVAIILINRNHEKEYTINLDIEKYLNDSYRDLQELNSYLDNKKVEINNKKLSFVISPLSTKVLLSY